MRFSLLARPQPMKLSRLASLALVATLALPALAQAQTDYWYAGVKDGSNNFNGIGVGPYQVSLNAGLTAKFDVFCLDFDNSAQAHWKGRLLTFAQATSNDINGQATARQLLGATSPLVNIQ